MAERTIQTVTHTWDVEHKVTITVSYNLEDLDAKKADKIKELTSTFLDETSDVLVGS